MRDVVLAHAVRAHRNAARADAYEQAFATDADWAIVLRFYAALHLTQAYLLTKAQRFHTEDHGGIGARDPRGPRAAARIFATRTAPCEARVSSFGTTRSTSRLRRTSPKRGRTLLSSSTRSRARFNRGSRSIREERGRQRDRCVERHNARGANPATAQNDSRFETPPLPRRGTRSKLGVYSSRVRLSPTSRRPSLKAEKRQARSARS